MKSIPDWPRMMRRSTAAAYLDMPVTDFERELSKGRLPMPIEFGGGERWSRTLLDEALERLTGERVPDYRLQSNFFLNNSDLLGGRNGDTSSKSPGRKR